jgi:hypothetical protein
MPIKLNIEVTSPLEPDDRQLLSGVAVMVLAIANHEMAKQAFPDAFPDDEETAEETAQEPTPCALVDSLNPNRICIGDVDHRGPHRFRRFPTDVGGVVGLRN